MAPVTDPLTDEEMPRARLGLLLQHFSELDDDREPWRVMYPLKEVLLLVTCATIASCDDFDDIVAWGEHHLDALRRFSTFHHGIPCERWLRALVNRIDPILFGRCFESWVAAQWPGRHEFIALDGKTSRRTHDNRKGLKALHTLSAYATSARLTLAQRAGKDQRNHRHPGSARSPRGDQAARGRARQHRRHGLPSRDRRQDRRPQSRLPARPQG